MKTSAVHHPKTKKLQRLLNLKLYEAIGLLEGLFQFACEYADDGRIGKWSPDVLADHLEWSGDPVELFQAFGSAGWIDGEGSAATIHDWLDHCPRYVTQRHQRAAAAAGGDQRAPAGAGVDEGPPTNQTKPNKPKPKRATTKQIESIWGRLKTTSGLKPPRRSKGREQLINELIECFGVDDVNSALDRFPLDSAKLYPEGFEPHVEWFARSVDKILEGNYSNKPRQTKGERRRMDVTQRIRAIKGAIESAKAENDRLYFESVLKQLTTEQEALTNA